MTGRPPIRRRQVLAYIERQHASAKPVTLGAIVRVCGLCDRSQAKRILKQLRESGLLTIEIGSAAPGAPRKNLHPDF